VHCRLAATRDGEVEDLKSTDGILAIRQTLTDGPELAGSGPADADLRSGASETGFSACSRRRQPVRGEMLFPARCGSAWPQP
jgi:hypothetical protein